MSISPITLGADYLSSCGAFPQSTVAGNHRLAAVADLVMEAAQSRPNDFALSANTDTMTFGELADRSKHMASYLAALGAGPETLIGLCLERSFDFVVSSLAVLLSGAAYLPLDPTWPAARLRSILEGAQAPLVISRGELASRVSGDGVRTIDLDTAAGSIERSDLLDAPVAVASDNLAYVIYTSGSTGQPKGVEVTQGNLLNLIFWHRNAFGITALDRASHLAGVGFDAAVWEIWPHLTAGATVVLVDEQARTSAELLRDWLVNERITVAFVPTIFAEPMLGHVWPTGDGSTVSAYGWRSVASPSLHSAAIRGSEQLWAHRVHCGCHFGSHSNFRDPRGRLHRLASRSRTRKFAFWTRPASPLPRAR